MRTGQQLPWLQKPSLSVLPESSHFKPMLYSQGRNWFPFTHSLNSPPASIAHTEREAAPPSRNCYYATLNCLSSNVQSECQDLSRTWWPLSPPQTRTEFPKRTALCPCLSTFFSFSWGKTSKYCGRVFQKLFSLGKTSYCASAFGKSVGDHLDSGRSGNVQTWLGPTTCVWWWSFSLSLIHSIGQFFLLKNVSPPR